MTTKNTYIHDQRGVWQTTFRAVRQASLWLLVVVSILIGVCGGATALLATMAATNSRLLAAIVGALVAVLLTGGLSWLAARSLSRGNWLPGMTTGISLVLVALLVGPVVFTPAPSYTALTPTDDTRYWDLPTGSRIAYTLTPAQGELKPTPVILVHGGPGAPGGGNEIVTETLSEAGFDVYYYHQVGAGLSVRLEDVSKYTVARHVADLESIRQVIGSQQVILIGGSWGGPLIANYMAAHPDRVAKVVVYSPGPIWTPAFPDDLTASGRRDQDAVIRKFPRFMLAHILLRTVGPKMTHALLPDQQIDGVFQALVGSLDLWSGCSAGQHPAGKPVYDEQAGVGFWANAMTSLDTERIADPRPVLRNVSTPVLVLRSECDYLAWEVTREYRDILPNAVLLTVENAGHTIPMDQPKLYRETVRAFLLDQPLPQEPYTGDGAPMSDE